MQPEDQPQYSIDYLDQISTAPPQKGMNDRLFPIVLIAGVVVALLVGIFAFLSTGTSNKDTVMHLAARLRTLQSIADSSKNNITSSDLRGTNTNLSLLLTTANQDIAAPLQANGIDVTKLDASIVASESGTNLKSRLEDARISGYFDRTYAREMSDQLATIIALTKEIEAKTNGKPLKDYLVITRNQLTPVQKQFADFNAATT